MKKRTVGGQKQYLVRWTAHNMLQRHIPLLAATGYKIEKVERCHEIHRMFGPTVGKLTARVTLMPKYEPADSGDIPQHLIDEFETRIMGERADIGHITHSDVSNIRKDEQKSNIDRQGYWIPLHKKPMPALIHEPHLDKLININPTDVINPDHDIPAPGVPIIRIEPHNDQNSEPHLSRIYNASGKACGTLTLERLSLLYKAFTHTQMYHADIHTKHKNPCFENAVLKLLIRYKNGHKKGSDETRITQEWSTPDGFMQAMAGGLTLTTERFASPLNFSPHLTGYYSMYEEDEVFGANYNAYSTRWKGASQATPEAGSAAADKAVRWAIASAEESQEPVLTALTLPWEGNTGTAYAKWLLHPMVQEIKTVKRTHIELGHPLKGVEAKPKRNKTKWDVKFIIVANDKGLQQFVRQDELQAGFRKAAQNREDEATKIQNILIKNNGMTPRLQRTLRGLHTPSKFNKVSYKQTENWRTTSETGTSLPDQMTNPVGLKYMPQDIIYTDGSSKEYHDIGQVTGSGIYREAAKAALEVTVKPCTQGLLNTITRAELAAIFVALQLCRPHEDEIIATDSKCSMEKIAKHLRNPALTKDDCHQPMLRAIVQMLVTRAQANLKTTLMKVKSHIGIKGNEMADKLANQAAHHAATDGNFSMDVSQDHLEDFDNKFWPKHKVTQQNSRGEEVTHWQNVRDLKSSLKAVVHDKLRLGQSNQDSVYFKAWQDVYGHMAPEYSNAFWNMPEIASNKITNLLKTRQGNTWTMKLAMQRNMAYRRGQPKATHDRCPLCNKSDSAGHMLGGCSHKEMKALYIARHDKAMRKLLKQVLSGKHGAHYTIADVGTLEGLQQLGVHGKRIPAFILQDDNLPTQDTHDCTQEEQTRMHERDKLRPDIMLVELTDKEREAYMTGEDMPLLNATMQTNRPRKVWIVEGGYCTDTRYSDKYRRKETQHEHLQTLLQARGFEIILLPIILGFTGAIYKTTVSALSALGIEKAQAKKLLYDLHAHAIQTHHTIIKLRRKLENTKQPKTSERPRNCMQPFEPP